MRIIYALEPFPTAVKKTLFLAGPTSRTAQAASWRSEALRLLEELGYDGHVFIPEPQGGFWAENYINQVEWEEEFLKAADVILFWVPRDIKGNHPEGNGSPMPGLTTNDEWGVWKYSGKVVWGSPKEADSTSYQKHYAKKLGVPMAGTLRETLELAVKKVGAGTPRSGVAAKVPSFIWTRKEFASWYESQTASGHEVRKVDIQWAFWVGAKRDRLFLYVAHVEVYVTVEDRVKANEVILFRPDISTVFLYKQGECLLDTKVVLVKEFRSPVRNSESFVFELPGGSSPEAGVDPNQTASDEVKEELGITIEPSRFKSHGSRQMGATLTAYHSHLFSAEITDEELAHIEADTETHGADDEERTYAQVFTIRDILANDLMDWSMLGMVFGAFH